MKQEPKKIFLIAREHFDLYNDNKVIVRAFVNKKDALEYLNVIQDVYKKLSDFYNGRVDDIEMGQAEDLTEKQCEYFVSQKKKFCHKTFHIEETSLFNSFYE